MHKCVYKAPLLSSDMFQSCRITFREFTCICACFPCEVNQISVTDSIVIVPENLCLHF
jgi:hypothetical protein